MPYEAGPSLRQRLARDGPLPLDDVVLILRDVCDALAHAHQHGIVHRDIKPDNVLLSGRHAMVADFGVAKALAADRSAAPDSADATAVVPANGLATLGAVFGTPAYMAPEQIAGDPHIDHRADIYAVGVLAYELLAGRPPFVGDTREMVLAGAPDSDARAADRASPRRARAARRAGDEVPREATGRPLAERRRAGPRGSRICAIAGRRTAPVAVAARAMGGGGLPRWRRSLSRSLIVFRRARWSRTPRGETRWANARVERLTDFPGSEVDAAISADGQLVAFLADRDSVFDAFVTRVGSGQFLNLTGGRLPQLFNEDVRNVGFSGDGAHVWIRVADITSPASVSLAPTGGGTAASISRHGGDGRVVAGRIDGSPITRPRRAIRSTSPTRSGGNARRIFVAEAGRSLSPPELVARRAISVFHAAACRLTTWTSGASRPTAGARSGSRGTTRGWRIRCCSTTARCSTPRRRTTAPDPGCTRWTSTAALPRAST